MSNKATKRDKKICENTLFSFGVKRQICLFSRVCKYVIFFQGILCAKLTGVKKKRFIVS